MIIVSTPATIRARADENVATNNGLAFSGTKLISDENMSSCEEMDVREQLRAAFGMFV